MTENKHICPDCGLEVRPWERFMKPCPNCGWNEPESIGPTAPHPVMACAECGAVITERVSKCPLCGSLKIQWVDIAAGLRWLAGVVSVDQDRQLLTDTADRLLTLEVANESMQQAQGGIKRRRQEVKADRLAKVIREWVNPRRDPEVDIDPNGVRMMPNEQWMEVVRVVNTRHPNDPIGLPSHETKALVAEIFAEPQEATDV